MKKNTKKIDPIGIGLKINGLIHAKNIKIIDLASRMGIGHNTITRWINEETYPDLKEFLKLMEILDVKDIHYFLTGEKLNEALQKELDQLKGQYSESVKVRHELEENIKKEISETMNSHHEYFNPEKKGKAKSPPSGS